MSTNLGLVQICWQNPTRGLSPMCKTFLYVAWPTHSLGWQFTCVISFSLWVSSQTQVPSAVATGLGKVSFSPVPKKGNASEYSNYCTNALTLHASKVTLKILQARLQQYMNWELPDVQPGFTKGRGTRDQITNICWIKKQETSRETSASLTTLKSLTVWITTNCGKCFKRWQNQTTLPASWEICMQVKKQQLEPDMKKWAGSKSGKEYNKDIYCHPGYLTYMQSISCKMLCWLNHKLESRLPGDISITSDMQMTPS